MKRSDFFLVFIILIFALLFRLYKFSTPLADLHSWRQADTAAVARNFVKDGFDLFHPRYDDLSNVQSGFENPQGYRMVEFPLYNALFAYLYKKFPLISLEQWGRLVSIFFSLIIIFIVYYLVLKEKGRLPAFFSGLIYAVFPYFVFFSRVVLPETTALTLSMISIFFLYQFSNIKKTNLFAICYLLFAILSFSLSLLTKPTTIFYSLPLVFLFFQKYRLNIIKKIPFYVFFALSFLPLFLWRNYIKNFPEGIPANEWLITSINTGNGLEKIFFRPAFFRWIFFERINNLILGGYLTFFFILGILSKQKKLFLFTILLSSLLYLTVFQGGNVQHEYYQTLILPALAIFCGLGINFIFENKKNISQTISIISLILIILFSWFFSFYQVKNFYSYSSEIIQQAKIINSLTNPDDKIVIDRMGDTTLLYLSDRKGSPSIYKPPEELKKIGYSFLITSSKEQIKAMESKYKIIFENEKFTIFKL